MAMADIADQAVQHGRARAVPLSEIAARQHLPVAYLEQLFGKLREANLVASVRGRSGGYRLARPAHGGVALAPSPRRTSSISPASPAISIRCTWITKRRRHRRLAGRLPTVCWDFPSSRV